LQFGFIGYLSGQQFTFDHYTQKDGLSLNEANFILEDKLGFIWISTRSGLNRFDGLQFKTYYHLPGNNKTPSTDLGGNLYEDKNGFMWYNTNHDNLNRYNPSNEQFVNYKPSPPEINKKDENVAFAFCEDAEGNLYMASKRGICKYNPEDQKIHLLEWNGKPILPDILNCLFVNTENRLFAGTEEGIYEVNIASKQVFKLPGIDNQLKTVLDIVEDKQGNLWIGTWKQGLIKYNLKTATSKVFRFDDDKLHENNWIFNDLAIQQIGGKEIIWSTSVGPYLLRFDIATNSLDAELLAPYFPELPGSIITAHLLVDQQNVVWITTSYGVLRLDPLKQLFKTYRLEPQKPVQYYSNVTAIYQDPVDKTGNTIWLAVPTWGLCKFDLQTQKATWYNNFVQQTIDEITVTKILRKDEDELWLATYSGLIKFNTLNSTFSVYTHKKTDTLSLSSNYISDLVYDLNGKLWVATFSNGLNCYTPDRDNFIRLQVDNKKIPLNVQLSQTINDIALDARGNLWVARGYALGKTAALSVINTSTFSETYYYQSAKNSNFPFQEEVYAVFPDTYGIIWMGIPAGAANFNPSEKKASYQLFSPGIGFQSSCVYGFVQDGNIIWANGNNGLTLLDVTKQQIIRSYMPEDGLLDYNISAFELGFDGKLFIGDYTAFQYIAINAIRPNKIIPRVHITGMSILDKAYFPDGKSVLYTDKVQLKYGQNKIKFEFAALNFTNPKNNMFAYKLEGFDNDWVYSKVPFVNYNKLPAGTYTFKVKAANDNGIWNNEGDTFLVVITSPWYQTIWFYLLVFLGVIALLWSIYKIRINQVLKMERMRNVISRDLHDDIGSTLSSINLMSKMAKTHKTNDTVKMNEILEKINNRSEYLMENMADIVWAVNPQNDQIENIVLRMRLFAADILEPLQINYQFQVSESILKFKIPLDIRRDFYLIYKEAINNCAKYADCKNVKIRIFTDAGFLNLIVNDDGVGFDNNSQPDGNGLRNFNLRAKKMQGNCYVKTAPGQGTEIQLKIPL